MEINKQLFIWGPLEQFKVRDFISLDAPILANVHVSITNIGLYILSAALITVIINKLVAKHKETITGV